MGEEQSRDSLAYIRDIAPDLERYISDFGYGEIWARPGLDERTRRLCTIAVLGALKHDAELKAHIGMALVNGVGRQEIVEVLLHNLLYAGFPAAWNGLKIAKDIFDEQGGL